MKHTPALHKMILAATLGITLTPCIGQAADEVDLIFSADGLTQLYYAYHSNPENAATPYFFAAKNEHGWSVLDANGHPLTSNTYQDVGLAHYLGWNRDLYLQHPEQIEEKTDEFNYLLSTSLIPVKTKQGTNFLRPDGSLLLPESITEYGPWQTDMIPVRTPSGFAAYDRSGQTILPPDKDPIQRSEHYWFRTDSKTKQTQIYHLSGTRIGDTTYIQPQETEYARIRFKSDKKWGLLDTDLSLLLPGDYDEIITVNQNRYWTRSGKQWTLRDTHNTPIPTPEYTDISAYSQGRSVAKIKGKKYYGYIDENGNPLTDFIYQKALPYTENLGGVVFSESRGNAHAAYLDLQGKEIFTTDEKDIYPFYNGLAEFHRKANSGFFATLLGTAFSFAIGSGTFYNHTHTEIKRGYLDTAGHKILSGKDDFVIPLLNHSHFIVMNNGTWGLVNRQGHQLLPNEYADTLPTGANHYLILKTPAGNVGLYYLPTEQMIVPTKYHDIRVLSQGYIAYRIGEKWGLMNPDGTLLTASRYRTIGDYHHDLINVSLPDHTVLYLDLKGKPVLTLPSEIEEGLPFYGHLAPVRVGKQWGLINDQGQWVIPPTYSIIRPI